MSRSDTDSTPAAARAEPPMNFIALLQSMRRGEILAEGDSHLTKVVEAIREHGGKGSITLSLALKMNKAGQIEITPDLKSQAPRRALSTGIFFADDDGNLTRRDPNQADWVDDINARRTRGNDD